MYNIVNTLMIGILTLFLIGCSTDEAVGPGEGEGRLILYLSDAPTEIFTEVNVEIERVEIYSEQEGWLEVKGQTEVYNLLELTGGEMALLADVVITSDIYSSIRLHIGGGSHVVFQGQMLDLEISSGAQGGVELEHHMELQSGATIEILLDFDAHRSVTGSLATLVLDPVIRVESMEETGSIAGEVAPVDAYAVVIASQNADVVTSTYADEETGSFTLIGLAEGQYNIEVVARAGNYRTALIENITVEAGATVNLDPITLEVENDQDT
jgi:hypothetical protein